MLQWPDTHTNDYTSYTTATTNYAPFQKPVYTENHIYKRRNRRAILAKQKGKGKAYVRDVLRGMY